MVTSAQAPRVPPNEPLNIPWPKKYHLASSKRLGLCAIKIRLLSLQFFSLNFLETSLSLVFSKTRERSRKFGRNAWLLSPTNPPYIRGSPE